MIKFSRSVPILMACLALGACSTVQRIVPGLGGAADTQSDAANGDTTAGQSDGQSTDQAEGEDASGSQTDAQAAGAAADGGSGSAALSISTPAPEEAAAVPAARLSGRGWQSRVSPDIPYFNLGGGTVPTYADSDLDERTGALATGEGGFVETCRDDAAVCRVATGSGGTVWVEITRLSGVAN